MKKRSILHLFLFAFIILSFSYCKDEVVLIPARTYADVQTDFQAIDISEGVHDEKLKFLNTERFWNFRVVAPSTTAGETYPLIIDLHGASGGAPNAHKHTDCYVEPGFADMDVFIISPNGGNLLWDDLTNQEMVINLLMLAKDFWPIDPNKVVVIGYSNGGNGSWFYGETQPDLFAAAIPIASSYSTTNLDGSVRVMPIPMYVIHGENDELFDVNDTQGWVDQSNAAGSDITFVIAPGLIHIEPCTYVDYVKDAATWLNEEVW